MDKDELDNPKKVSESYKLIKPEEGTSFIRVEKEINAEKWENSDVYYKKLDNLNNASIDDYSCKIIQEVVIKEEDDCDGLQSLATEEEMVIVENIEQNDSKLKCHICNKTLRNKKRLREHLKYNHRNQDYNNAVYKCMECSKTFASQKILKNHKKTHEDVRPFPCEECGRTFKRLGNLNEHLLTHTDAKPYKCDECEKTFKMFSPLQRHKKTHSNLKPHKCQHCGLSFCRLDALQQHKIIHSDIKLHSCDVCGKAFKLAYTLKTHKLTHTDFHPCKYCYAIFNRINALKRHLKEHKCGKTVSQDAPLLE